jgi:hypothetical protein
MKTTLRALALAPLALFACNKAPETAAPVAPATAPAAASKAAAVTAAAIAGESPHAGTIPGENPHAAPAAAGAGSVSGKVAERMNAGGYTYLRLTTAQGDVWAAVPETTTAVGADVVIEKPMPMNGFESKTLGRKFDQLYFGTLGGAGGGAAPVAAQGASGSQPTTGAGSQPMALDPNMPHGPTATVPAAMGPISVAKATGPDARTVSEVFAQKAALKDKPVTVRGKVVKFSGGVMGKNWVHLRDGSGGDATKDNDLTFTTQSVVAVGDEVTAKGVVHTDKDFGAGYFYAVIVEEATVTK